MALALQTKEEIPKEAASPAPAADSGAVKPKIGVRPAFLNKNNDIDIGAEIGFTDEVATRARPSSSTAVVKSPSGERRLRMGTLLWVFAAVVLLALTLQGVPSVRKEKAASPVPMPSVPEAGNTSQGQSFIPPQPDIAAQIVTMPRPSNETPEAKGTRKELLSIISQ